MALQALAVDDATVSEGGCSAFSRWRDTVAPDAQRPLAGIRLLIVSENVLVRGVFGGGVSPVEQVVAKGADKRVKVVFGGKIKAAK